MSRGDTLPATLDHSAALIFAVLIAVGAIFTVFRIGAPGRRRRALRKAAHQLGLTVEGESWSSSSRAPQLQEPLFTKGEDKKFHNIFSSSQEHITTNFFDYSYRGTRGRISQTVAAFTQDQLLPAFELAPRVVLGAAGSKDGIRLDLYADFSTKFRLRGPDEKKLQIFFASEVAFFLESLAGAAWRLEAFEFTLILYRDGQLARPADFPDFVRQTTEIARGFLELAH